MIWNTALCNSSTFFKCPYKMWNFTKNLLWCDLTLLVRPSRVQDCPWATFLGGKGTCSAPSCGWRCQLHQAREKWNILGNVFWVDKEVWVVSVRPKGKWHIPQSQMAHFLATGFGCESEGEACLCGCQGARVAGCIPSQALGKLHHLVHTIMRDTPLDLVLKRYRAGARNGDVD